MALNEDEKKLLAELNARAAEPDEDDDYEIEIYDTHQNKGARIPYRTGKSWLHDVFGIGQAPAAPEGGDGGESGGAGEGAPPAGPARTTKKAGRTYFGGA